jgi:hypothetical protein
MATEDSQYASTRIVNDYLDILSMPSIPKRSDDEYYTIENKYHQRPDLLAYKLYGTTRLWWVFIVRNMDLFEDPIEDFTAGTIIRLPNYDAIAGQR